MSLTVNIERLVIKMSSPAWPTLAIAQALSQRPPNTRATAAPAPRLDLFAKPNAIRIAEDGTHLQAEDTTTPHVAVLFPDYGVMVSTSSLGDDDLTQQEAVKVARQLKLLGHTDWYLADRVIWEQLVLDTSRIDLAVDPFLFPGIKPGWHWTSTMRAKRADEAAGDSAYAWGVSSSDGYVDGVLRDNRGFGLAARFVGQ